MTTSENFGLDPFAVYTKNSAEVKRVLPLKRSALAEAIAKGRIPPPFPLYEGGLLKAWTGAQLIEICRARLDHQQRETERLAQRRAVPTQSRAAKKRRK